MPGFSYSSARAINSIGQVVVVMSRNAVRCRSYLWDNGRWTDKDQIIGMMEIEAGA